MKDTPALNDAVVKINDAIENLAYFTDFDDEPFVCMYPVDSAEDLQASINDIKSINIETLKSEFIDTLEDYNSIFFQKKLFEFKLEKLLDWKHDYDDGLEINERKYRNEFTEFSDYQMRYQINTNTQEYGRLRATYVNLNAGITMLKQRVRTMLEQYKALGDIYLQEKKLMIVSVDNKHSAFTPKNINLLAVSIASKRKTDIVKILSAMYDARMFAGADGKPLTNKQKLMEAFGEFLGDDFSSYSTLLSQSKVRDEKTFMKPFRDIEKAAERYFYEETTNTLI